MARILVVDDDPMVRELLSHAITDQGHDAVQAEDLAQASGWLRSEECDVVYLDVRLPDGNGLEVLERARENPARPEVIIITGDGDPDGAELAMRNGAWDYIQKPTSLDRMLLPLVQALRYRKEKSRAAQPLLLDRDEIIGNSQAIQDCLRQVAKAAASSTDTLITGETGTGKELFARAIHDNSPRKDRPFVVVDCTALPVTLAESALFGHVRGAFTGADREQKGLVEQAHGGTLFLDEVGELPADMQAKFLRVLQERSFRPVGADAERRSDFQLVAATNRPLAEMAEDGRFRTDLLYRLKAFTITLPPLRNRREDIKDLVHFYLAKTGGRFRGGIKGVSPEFIKALWDHDWPGNVRELFQVLETSLVSAHEEPTLYPKHLPVELRVHTARRGMRPPGPAPMRDDAPATPPWKTFRAMVLDDAERTYFGNLMTLTDHDVNAACDVSGVKKARLYQLLKKHDIRRR